MSISCILALVGSDSLYKTYIKYIHTYYIHTIYILSRYTYSILYILFISDRMQCTTHVIL